MKGRGWESAGSAGEGETCVSSQHRRPGARAGRVRLARELGGRARVMRAGVLTHRPWFPNHPASAASLRTRLCDCPGRGPSKRRLFSNGTARLAPDLLFDLLFYKKYPYKNIVAYCFF